MQLQLPPEITVTFGLPRKDGVAISVCDSGGRELLLQLRSPGDAA